MISSSPVYLDNHTVRAFIQARMSSTRFPGKVLAPLNGVPVIKHVINRISQVLPPNQITVLTSDHQSDDPLASYIDSIGVSVYRGPLNNVFARFQSCLKTFPCDWFVRICGDSPLLDSSLLADFIEYSDRTDLDVVTNVQVRTFPVGQSIEMISSQTFSAIDANRLSADEQEHITKVFYERPGKFRILNIESTHPVLADLRLAVDTVEDLSFLESRLQEQEGEVVENPVTEILSNL